MGLVLTEIANLPEEDRVPICTDAYRAFYLGSIGHDPAEAMEAIVAEQ